MEEGKMEHDTLQDIFDGIIKPTDVEFSALQRITRNFSEEQIIGEGGFGTVYKGVLRNGEVAVKRITNDKTIYDEQFQREVTSLLNVSHKNIVRFIGFCSHTVHKAVHHEGQYVYAENRDRLLCFEYVNKGSLEKYITDELRGLEWDTRYLIIKGICEGLQYLHEKVGIIHRDLKPANILIDNNMVAKITDFGLSRVMKNAQTRSKNHFSSRGYTPPEYIDSGEISVKYDVYSLGVIIVELVTGSRSIPHSDIVLRRWRHRLHKLGKETSYICKQIAKLIEIGRRCQENKPYKRPSIEEIILDIEKLESTSRENNNANESTINPYSEDGMLGIEPLELRFPFELNRQISCSFELTNETNAFIAFSVHKMSPLSYCIQPNKDIVAPRSKYKVNITMQPLDEAPQDKDTGCFIVRSTKVKESLINDHITEKIFSTEDGKLVDEVNLTITYKGEVPQVDVSFESLIISDTTNLHRTQESNVPPTEAESKINASTSDEVIQLDPPELRSPLVPHKKVLSSFKIINVTESYVSFMISYELANTGKYIWSKVASVLPPRSTECLSVTREVTEDAVKEVQLNDGFMVGYALVDEDIKACDLDIRDYNVHKKLPVVLKEGHSCTSNELIQFDPPELSFPCLYKTSLSSVNIVNITDCYVGLNIWFGKKNDAFYETEPRRGILPPRSTQRMVVRRIPKEQKPEGKQCKNEFLISNMIVAEGFEASSIQGWYTSVKEMKELPLTFIKISPCSSDELIRFDHPGLCFAILHNNTSLCSVNMVNLTDYYVDFLLFNKDEDVAVSYQANPKLGILAPRSAQRLVVARVIKEKEPEGTQYNDDKLFMWNDIVSEGIKVSDLEIHISLNELSRFLILKHVIGRAGVSDFGYDIPIQKIPITLNKVTSSTSVKLIKFNPPEIRFPFLPRKDLSSSFKIVNITEYHIGFNTRAEETNMALYITEPSCGILPPWSIQELVVTRVAKEEAPELEEKQCTDKYYVWSCFVTEDVNASDIEEWMPITERKELPIIFTETSSNELIQFDPPTLCLPLLPKQRVLSSSKMVNITDQYIGFRICPKKSNSARYNVNPSEGILSPLSTQVLLIKRIAEEKELEDTECTDKFLVWNSIVTEDVKASDVIHNMPETKCTEFPIVVTEQTNSSISDELIHFDLLELHFPFFPKKKVSTSIKIENLTDYPVGFNTHTRPTNAAWYHTEPPRGILPARSTQKLIVTREEKEDVLEDKRFNDKYFVWKSIVSEGVKDSDLSDCITDQESKELPIVLDKISSSISDELIQLDPAELCIPLLLNKHMLLFVNIVNTTDFYVAFSSYWIERAAARYKRSVKNGILPPRCTKKLTLSWTTSEQEFKDMEPGRDIFVWNRVVTERVESGDINGYMIADESKKLPVIFNKASPCALNQLIQFDPPEISLPFSNKPLVFSFNIANITDFCASFQTRFPARNVGLYKVRPASARMEPWSTQTVVVKMTPKKKELEDGQYEDALIIYSGLAREGVEASDFVDCIYYKVGTELPIVYKKTSVCTLDELIQLDPPQLSFPFLPNKRVPMLRLFKLVNVTDHIVSFSIGFDEDNCAWYKTEQDKGILPPQSTQVIKIGRTLKENKTEDMQRKDKILVNGNVTEGVQFGDVGVHWKNHDIELPVVLKKPGSSPR